MEHLHPDDALEQLANVYKALKPGGCYVCITPNQLSGPHDVSMYFDETATGFHLKEYTNTEILNLFQQIGFSKIDLYSGKAGYYTKVPTGALTRLERWLMGMSQKQKKVFSKNLLVRTLISIQAVATK